MRKNLLLSLFLTVGMSAVTFAQTGKAVKATESSSEKNSDKEAENLRKQHAAHLENNPFKETFKMTKSERKAHGLPPNKYNEQEWILSMNPALGRPTPENLEKIRQDLQREREAMMASGRVPGDGTSAWTERGPNNVGGRTRAIIFDPTDGTNNTVIAGGVSGGLWKNTNISSAGSTWTRLSLPRNLNVQVLTVDPNNSQTWYAGTGESCVFGDVNGQGLWKTTDAGATWNQIYGGGAVTTTPRSVFNLSVIAPSNPAAIKGYVTTLAGWAGGAITAPITAQIVLFDDGTAPNDDACTAATTANAAALNGKIALIRRGACTFESKTVQAEAAGAVAVILMNNGPAGPGDPIGMADDALTDGNIPTVMISGADGDLLVANMNANLTGTISPTPVGGFTGNEVSGYTFVNDVVVKNNGGTSEIYMAVGDGYYSEARNNTYFGSATYGLYKSTNGGSTWTELTLPSAPSGNKTCPNDIEIAANGDIWVGSTDSWTFGDGGGKVFRSQNNGTSFSLMHTISAATGRVGQRVEIETAPSDATTMYVLSQLNQNNTAGDELEVQLLRSTNANAATPTFSILALPNTNESRMNPYGFTGAQAFYNLVVECDPTNPEILYVGGLDWSRSANAKTGGTVTWTNISRWTTSTGNYGGTSFSGSIVHSDQHALTFSPTTPNIAVIGCDGGVYYSSSLSTSSTNNTVTTARNNGFNVTQFVGVAVRPTRSGTTGDFFIAGAQDNGSNYFPSSLNTTTGATSVSGSAQVQGGDGGKPVFFQGAAGTDYYVSNYVYNDNVNVRNLNGTIRKTLTGSANLGLFYPAFALDSANNILYSDAVDTTIAAPGTPYQICRYAGLTAGGGTTAGVTRTMLNYVTLMNSYATAITPGKVTSTTLYIGTMNGKLLKLLNANTVTAANSTAGTGWSNISGPSFVGSVSDVEFGANDNQIFVTMHNYGVNNIWYTPNGGTNWYRLDGNLPDLPVKSIIQNPNNAAELLIGTELGTWSTNTFNAATAGDQALTWVQSYNGMQDVKVTDLDIQKSDVSATTFNVFASTYGRGVFSGPLESTLATEQHQLVSDSFKVYPTIGNGNVTVASSKYFGETTFELFDITGKKVYSKVINLDSNEKQMNFNTVGTGNFILKFSGNGFEGSKRLIINN